MRGKIQGGRAAAFGLTQSSWADLRTPGSNSPDPGPGQARFRRSRIVTDHIWQHTARAALPASPPTATMQIRAFGGASPSFGRQVTFVILECKMLSGLAAAQKMLSNPARLSPLAYN